jgi:hypothetical protein
MSDTQITDRLHALHAVADDFADKMSELAVLIQDDEEHADLTKTLTAALGGMEAVERLLELAVKGVTT